MDNTNSNQKEIRTKPRKKLPPRKKADDNVESISIVIPLFNEEESLNQLAEQIESEMNTLFGEEWEVIFVDDGSTDNSYQVVKKIHDKNNKFKAIRFRRNFGKSAALSAGFANAKNKYVATMDADLQDDPKEFKEMLQLIRRGYDLVSGWKKTRHDPLEKRLPSKLFNFVTSKCSGIRLHDFNCGIKLYRREVVQSLDVYGEMHRYLPALAHWNGFKVTEMPVEHHKRQFGHSKFGFARYIRGFLDLLTVVFTTRYLKRPMHFFGVWGTIFMLIGFIIFAFLSVEWLCGEVHLSERPLAWFSMGLVIIGIQFFSIGLIGELLVKQSFTNNSKNYLIKSKIK
ncbi:MAG: glycosyltransferase family 2 protein [Ignavibacteria bacterium]|jgi:glycosyltransferase involved in cell wall biosynthesis|nr:glycosyltransferase family 2 protein [Ignavibacteria bacterium]